MSSGDFDVPCGELPAPGPPQPQEKSFLRRIAVPLIPVLLLALPAGASALTVTKAELSNGQLRLEGAGASPAGAVVMAQSVFSVAGARIDRKGAFRIEAASFRADHCRVVVSDGRTPIATSTLSGCTPKPVTPTFDTPPTGSCVIAPASPATFNVGDVSTDFFTTTGCDTSTAPEQWSLVAGHIPLGMTAPVSQGQTAGAVSGRPVTEGTFTFTVRVTDSIGATDTETFTMTVGPPRPLTLANPETLQPVARGQAYQILLTGDGGLPGYTYRLAGGTLPPGIQIASGSIAGTPTTAGTYSFTVAVTDSRATT